MCEVGCNATYEGNAVRVVCGESSDIQSIAYYINREGNYTGLHSYYATLFLSAVVDALFSTVYSSEFVIDGDLLTREQNDVEVSVSCQSGGINSLRHQLGMLCLFRFTCVLDVLV